MQDGMKLSAGDIERLIAEGEHENQDFKFRVDDAKKIARSVSAFANNSGGRLLIGVKDNGRIAGVRSDEEYYVVESAAQMYVKPPVPIHAEDAICQGKAVLVVHVPAGDGAPYCAQDEAGRWVAYYRIADENVRAHAVLFEYFKLRRRKQARLVEYSEDEASVLHFLDQHEKVAFNVLQKKLFVPPRRLIAVVAQLMCFGLVWFEWEGNQFLFYSAENQ